ncbi:cytosolic Fe-S cluster assembly factor NUBP2 homolog isoform X2 [Oculina patagonica]
MRRVCCIKMATMKTQEKKCKSIKHVPIPVPQKGVDKHFWTSTVELQIAWTMLSSCNSGKDGILDVDLCEPSIPRMRKKIIHQTQYSSGKNHTSGSFYQI